LKLFAIIFATIVFFRTLSLEFNLAGIAAPVLCGFYLLAGARRRFLLFVGVLFPICVLAHVLELALCCFCFGALIAANQRRSTWNNLSAGALFFVFTFILPLCRALILEFDQTLLTDIVSIGGLSSLRDALKMGIVPAQSGVESIARIFILLLVVSAVSNLKLYRPTQYLELLRGLALSTLIALLLVLIQIFELPVLDKLSPFWRFLARYSGPFTDPNALGVASALLLFVVRVGSAGRERVILLLSTFLIGLASGSRTFFVGALLFAASNALHYAAQRGKLTKRNIISVVVAGVAGIALLVIPLVNRALQQLSPIVSVDRLLQTLNIESAGGMFFSRSVYSQIAIRVFESSPFLGVGLGRFYQQQVAAMNSLGISLDGWLDNANNFYLEILAEGGLLSLVFLFVSLFLLRTSFRNASTDEDSFFMQAGLATLSLMLLTGPHLSFSEVSFLSGVIVGGAILKSSSVRFSRRFIHSVIISCIGLVFFLTPKPISSGLYLADSPLDSNLRWSGKNVRLKGCEGTEIQVRSLYPRQELRPQILKFNNGEELILKDHEWHKLGRERGEIIGFTVAPAWRPERGDPRWLGVQILSSGPLC